MRECQAPECAKPAKSGGYCWAHYCRLYRHGDLNFRLRRANGEGYYYRGRKMYGFNRQMRQEAVIIVERVLGKPLPKGAIVHHMNDDKMDCRNENLAVLQNQGIHNIVHGRLKAFRATGDVHAKPCRFCHQYDSPEALVKNGTSHYHKKCSSEYDAKYRARLKQQQREVRQRHESLQDPVGEGRVSCRRFTPA